MHDLSKKYWWILLGVWFLVFLLHLDVLPVNIMEARNFVTAREMVHLDNWLLTTMNAEPRYQKPPLPTWFTAASGMVMGFDNLFALRLPAALASLMLLYFFFRFLLKLSVSEKQALISSLILATSFYVIFAGRNGQWDIFTHSFMMGSIYYLWKFFRSNKGLYKNAFLAAFLFGLSFMSKGPVSMYALLLPFLIAYGWVYRFRYFKRRRLPLALFIVGSIIFGGWWYLYLRLADPITFLEITKAETENWSTHNVRPFYYYWNFFVQSGIWTIPAFIGLLYPYLRDRVSRKKEYIFSLLWTLSAVVLLSLVGEKKSRYLLPVLVPLAFNTSFYIIYLFQRFRQLSTKEKWIPYFNFGLIACLGILFPFAAPFVLELEGYWLWYILTSIVLFTIGVCMWYFLKQQEFSKVFYLSVAFICGIMTVGFPLANALVENPRFKSVRELQDKSSFPVYLYRLSSPEIIWDHGQVLPVLSKKELIEHRVQKFGLLVVETDTSFIKALDRFRILSTDRYDLNYVHPEKQGYKDRLIRRWYVLERTE